MFTIIYICIFIIIGLYIIFIIKESISSKKDTNETQKYLSTQPALPIVNIENPIKLDINLPINNNYNNSQGQDIKLNQNAVENNNAVQNNNASTTPQALQIYQTNTEQSVNQTSALNNLKGIITNSMKYFVLNQYGLLLTDMKNRTLVIGDIPIYILNQKLWNGKFLRYDVNASQYIFSDDKNNIYNFDSNFLTKTYTIPNKTGANSYLNDTIQYINLNINTPTKFEIKCIVHFYTGNPKKKESKEDEIKSGIKNALGSTHNLIGQVAKAIWDQVETSNTINIGYYKLQLVELITDIDSKTILSEKILCETHGISNDETIRSNITFTLSMIVNIQSNTKLCLRIISADPKYNNRFWYYNEQIVNMAINLNIKKI